MSTTAERVTAPVSARLSPEFLQREYVQKQRTLADIGAEVGCSAERVRQIARAHGIAVQTRNPVAADPKMMQAWAAERNAELGYRPETTPQYTATRLWWHCQSDPGHVFLAPTAQIRRLTPVRCLDCRVTTVGERIDAGDDGAYPWCAQHSPDDARTWTHGTKRKLCWICPEHGHFNASPMNRLLRGHGCPKCAGKFGHTLADTPDLLTELADPDVAGRTALLSKHPVFWKCRRNPEHRWSSAARHRVFMGSGCPHCPSEARRLDRQQRLRVLFDKAGYTGHVPLVVVDGHPVLVTAAWPSRRTAVILLERGIEAKRTPEQAGTLTTAGWTVLVLPSADTFTTPARWMIAENDLDALAADLITAGTLGDPGRRRRVRAETGTDLGQGCTVTELGRQVRELRLRHHQTPLQVSARAELSRGHLTALERGAHRLSWTTLYAILRALDVSDEDLPGWYQAWERAFAAPQDRR